MGKTVIDASDGPGFLVNRCNRPFGLEALRMLAERIADDRDDRPDLPHGGRLPDGALRADGPGRDRHRPRGLQELLRAELRRAALASLADLAPATPQPACTGARAASATTTTARLADGGRYREEDPAPPQPEPGAAEGVLVISGEGVLADELRAAARAAGFELRAPHEPSGGVLPSLIIECDREPAGERAGADGADAAERGAARMVLCARGSLSALDPAGSAVGFHVLPSFEQAGLVELTRSESSSPLAAERAERLLAALGKHVAWVGDAPGLVLGRIVCQVINESSFALGEGVGEAADIDTGHAARAEPSPRAAASGRTRSASTTCSTCSRRSATSTARSATGLRRRCASELRRGAPAAPRAAGSSTIRR